MASAVWGIDIGQCSLKALRCTYDPREKKVVADVCDFIEYEKILSQPDADPEALVRDAIKEFLSRNSVRGDKVAISVAGQQGLARFIKLPPVELKKLPKIVEFEAKQQIPFDLEDVIWDYQMLVGGVDADGMALENEVGLFAMKRDQVMRAIQPLDDAGVEIDFIQLTPVSVLNTAVHSVLGELPPVSEFDPDNPPDSVVILSMGTDTTDLVVTNGYRVWQRSIPLGGNHFTKQLTKELKMTFGKSEHLKRNSREAEDPKKVFQAMRPVFNDLVTEVQRSIGYFESLDRNAKISKIVGLGNAFKLPGLEPYLEKNVGHNIEVLSKYPHLTGAVLEDDKFKKNSQSMAVPYGLALQGLGEAKMKTNLVPRELLTARMIRRKKPWVLAAASLLLAGFALNFALHAARTQSVSEEKYSSVANGVNRVSSTSSGLASTDDANKTLYGKLESVGNQVIDGGDRRFQLLELMRVIDGALPREPDLAPGQASQREMEPLNPKLQRKELYIDTMEMKYYTSDSEADDAVGLEEWFDEAATERFAATLTMLQAMKAMKAMKAGAAPKKAADGEDAAMDEEPAEEAPSVEAPTGSGWVVELSGFHLHNSSQWPERMATEYVKRTLVRNLMEGSVSLPGPDGKPMNFTNKEMGISHVLIAYDGGIHSKKEFPNPNYVAPIDPYYQEDPVARLPGQVVEEKEEVNEPKMLRPKTHEFKVHFLWKPTHLSKRLEDREAAANSSDTTAEEGDI